MKQSRSNEPDALELEGEERDDAIIGYAFRWSLAAILVLAAVGGGVAYWLLRPPKPVTTQRQQLKLPEVRSNVEIPIPLTPFVDVTKLSGVDFEHQNGAYGDKLLPETMGSGCAVFDYDNDGDQDVLFVNSTLWPWDPRPRQSAPPTMALYANDGQMGFRNVSAETGLNVSCYGMGCGVGDYDNDGDVDLFISAVGSNHLFQNNGGRFEEVTEQAGVAGHPAAWSTSCGWFDYNNDGRLDLIVCNYVKWSKEIDLSQDFRLDGVGRAYGPPSAFQGAFPFLYRNDGGGKFTDVSPQAGVQIRNPATDVPIAKSMGVAPADLDRDGWMDLVIANDTVQNFVLHNRRDGSFEEMGALTGVAYDSRGEARGAMGIDVAYFRNDRSLGIAIGNFANEATALYVAGDDSMQFMDQAIATGLGPPTRLELTFGLFFFDYDLDGRLDLLAANGHLEEDIHKVQESQQYEQPPQLFWNSGAEQMSEYVKVSAEHCGQDLLRRMVGRGAAYGDLDGDGDLDIVLTASGGPPRLLRNEQQLGHHWLRLKLIGEHCNRDAIGARVEAHTGDVTRRCVVMPTRSYLSQCELPLTFGLGADDHVDKLVIHWPDGETQEIESPRIDELMIVQQTER